MTIKDRVLTISVGSSRRDTMWRQTRMTVAELYDRLGNPVRGTETMQEYLHFPKQQQDALKDVGGFVGGALSGPRRKANSVTGRDLITLDFDNIPGWTTDSVIGKVAAIGCSYCVYSTRKHGPAAPRLRVVIPTARTMTPDEYEPVARRVAADIGIEMADPSTFEVCRLMYWPSCCADSEFVHCCGGDGLLDVEAVLGTYTDWRDVRSWPQTPNAVNPRTLAVKQGEPTEKPGTVGAFCRTYDIAAAMDKFLPGIYAPVDDDPHRYTYCSGSTTGGAVLYKDGKFLFSHHATDPCSGRLVNAFDLVRLHKYAELDDAANADTPVAKLPSYKAMCDFALADKAVCADLNRKQAEEFSGLDGGSKGGSPADDMAWTEGLQRTQDGKIKNTINNALLIMNNDPLLKGKFALNEFTGRGEVLGPLPWADTDKRRMWSDTDSNGLYWYMELRWQLTGRGNIDSALDIHAATHAFNDVRDFIDELAWDGVPRLDTLFCDYLGAEDTEYNRAVCRKSFTAAIARAMDPGCKFDCMVILAGKQGVGKSTLLDKMSRGWFNDSIRTFEGKDASELLQGVWLVEISELDAFRRTDVARIKQFLSIRADRYRAAYGRNASEFPRRCVFFGSTNTMDFLQDTTGNRRFWPVDVARVPHAKNVWDDLTDEVIRQVWAEAKARWQSGEPLYLSGSVEETSRELQEMHREVSAREGLIADFAEQPVPEDWQRWDLNKRRDWWAGLSRSAEGQEIRTVERTRICAAEVWCELFGGSIATVRPNDIREINGVLSRLDGWDAGGKAMRFGPHGVQRGFVKKFVF